MPKKTVSAPSVVNKTELILDTEELPVIWVGDMDVEKAQDIIKELIKLDSDPEVHEIFMYITSYGGDVFAVIGILEAMRNCSKPVSTVGLGLCASGGGILLAAGTGSRYMTSNSFMHIHHIQTSMKSDLPGIEQDVAQTKCVEDRIFSVITEKATIDSATLVKKLEVNRREWQLSATQAKKMGFIDVIGMPKLKRYIVTEKE